MQKSVYIESSVISYITAKPSRNLITSARQAITVEWWEEYRDSYQIFISQLVIEEIGSGDELAAKRRLNIAHDIRLLETTQG
ncbi:MAG: hypothetical protein L3J52_03020 [Proteobacteria bacterium]|nr:hypothetical protein [Pseudomonadota bacterium]